MVCCIRVFPSLRLFLNLFLLFSQAQLIVQAPAGVSNITNTTLHVCSITYPDETVLHIQPGATSVLANTTLDTIEYQGVRLDMMLSLNPNATRGCIKIEPYVNGQQIGVRLLYGDPLEEPLEDVAIFI
ncbi:hypothetical protein B0H11DRAFT_1163914 [Mycena galericulata]|nr:hypothetical protein B0H11DRAFT_1163914 [Mycena galericulata]